jgi:hypothetical protein
VRLYSHLFTAEEPSDANWEAELNPESEIVCPNAMVDPSIFRWTPTAETHFQFERIGFFVTDKDSTYGGVSSDKLAALTPAQAAAAGVKLVFNLTVNLKDSKPKAAGAPGKSRKEEQAKQLAEKMVRGSYIHTDTFIIIGQSQVTDADVWHLATILLASIVYRSYYFPHLLSALSLLFLYVFAL